MADSSVQKEDIECVQKIRERLGKDLHTFFNDDFSLVRWSIGWNRKLEAIEPRLRTAIRTLQAYNLLHENEPLLSFDEISQECAAICPAGKYFAGKVLGYDKNGHIVYLSKTTDCEGLFHSVKYTDFYRKMITETLRTVQLFRAEEKRTGRMSGTVIIMDMAGFSFSQLSAMSGIFPMMQPVQDIFPDSLKAFFLLNAPPFIQVMWSMIKPFLPKQTLDKIRIVGNDWIEVLQEKVGDDIYTRYVQERDTPRDDAKVPTELRYDKNNDLAAERLTKLQIGARSVEIIAVRLEDTKPGRRLRWWWRLDAHDISFAIYRSNGKQEQETEQNDEIMIYPKFKIQTDYVPEDGEVLAEEPGVYKFVFDNTHSKLRSKTIRYNIEIV